MHMALLLVNVQICSHIIKILSLLQPVKQLEKTISVISRVCNAVSKIIGRQKESNPRT